MHNAGKGSILPRLKGEGTLVDADFKGEFKQGTALPGPGPPAP